MPTSQELLDQILKRNQQVAQAQAQQPPAQRPQFTDAQIKPVQDLLAMAGEESSRENAIRMLEAQRKAYEGITYASGYEYKNDPIWALGARLTGIGGAAPEPGEAGWEPGTPLSEAQQYHYGVKSYAQQAAGTVKMSPETKLETQKQQFREAIKAGDIPKGSKFLSPFLAPSIDRAARKLADREGMSLNAAKKTIQRFQKNPESPEFSRVKETLEELTGWRYEAPKARAEPFEKLIEQARAGSPKSRQEARQKLYDQGYAKADIDAVIKFRTGNVIIGGQAMKVEDFNNLPYKYRHIALTDPEGFDAMDMAMKKDAREFERGHIIIKGQAMKNEDWMQIAPQYQKIAVRDGFEAMEQAMNLDYDKYVAASQRLELYQNKDGTYDLETLADFVEKNPSTGKDTLKDAGFDHKTIKDVEMAIAGRETKYIDRGTGKVITEAEYKALGDSRERDKYVLTLETGKGRTIRNYTIVAAESVIPGLYSAKHWNDMSAGEKAFMIGFDVFSVALPIAGAAARGARAVSTAGRMARLAGAAKGAAGETVAVLTAPVDLIFHPIGGVKVTAKSIRAFAENVASKSKIPESVLTTTHSAIAIRIGKDMSAAKAMAVIDYLTSILKPGERIMATVGNQTVELAQSPFMREVRKAGGGMVHGGPDIGVIAKGTTVKYKPGMPAKEQGWFLSPEPLTRFTKGSAFGKGKIPVPEFAGGKVTEIAKFRPGDIVRVDKAPIRPLDFADAANIPSDLARKLQNYAIRNDAILYGSLNEWIKLGKAAKPNDFDLVFRNSKKAIKDILAIAKEAGYEAREVPHGVEILKDGKWVKLGDIVSMAQHRKMLPGVDIITNKVNGMRVETLGKQYIGQSYGAIAKDAKAATRAAKLEKAAKDVKAILKAKGAEKMQPGFYVTSRELAEQTVASGKTFHETVEAERVLKVGGKIEKAQQHIYTRIGPESERLELYLARPLSESTILKLKAEGLIEWAKTPFKPAITIKEIKGVEAIKGLTKAQANRLARILKDAGNADEASELMRTERMVRTSTVARAAGRLIMPSLASRLRGRVKASEVARARAQLERTIAARRLIRALERPDRIRLERGKPERIKRADGTETGRIPTLSLNRTPPRGGDFDRDRMSSRVEPGRDRAPRIGEASIGRVPGGTTLPTVPTTPVEPGKPLKPGQPKTPRISRLKLPPPEEPGKPKKPGKGPAKKETGKRHDFQYAITWRQGLFWWVLWPDGYARALKEKPEGAKVVPPPIKKTPKATIQMLSGTPPKKPQLLDMGIMDVTLNQPPKNPNTKKDAIGFTLDRHQKTTSDIILGRPRSSRNGSGMPTMPRGKLRSKKRGRLFYTRAGTETLISRRKLGGLV